MEREVLCYHSTCTWLVLDWKSTWCTWCLPSTLSTCTCTCKYEKVLVLDSSTSKNTWPHPCLGTNSSEIFIEIFSCDQAALWIVQSVCPFVTPFSLCSYHRIIIKFSGVITNDRSEVHAKGQGHRSKVKVTEVKTLLSRFRTVTPV